MISVDYSAIFSNFVPWRIVLSLIVWEESPGRKEQCTVESTDRRGVYARVTENNRRSSAWQQCRSLQRCEPNAQDRRPMVDRLHTTVRVKM